MDEDRNIEMTENREPLREVGLKFAGEPVQLLGWGVVAILAFIPLSIPVAWFYAAMGRWLARNTKAEDGTTFTFNGNPKQIWYWFPIQGLLSFLHGRAQDSGSPLVGPLFVANLFLSLYIGWIIARWFAEGTSVREQFGFTFTAKPLHYIGWQILYGLSYVTLIGWAWVAVAMQKWIYRNMQSDDVELRFDGNPVELLKLGWLYLGCPAVIVLVTYWLADKWFWVPLLLTVMALPWLLFQILSWYVRNTVLLIRAQELQEIAPVETAQ